MASRLETFIRRGFVNLHSRQKQKAGNPVLQYVFTYIICTYFVSVYIEVYVYVCGSGAFSLRDQNGLCHTLNGKQAK